MRMRQSLHKKIVWGLLSASMGVCLFAAPLVSTVQASEKTTPTTYQNSTQPDSQQAKSKSQAKQLERSGLHIANQGKTPLEVVKNAAAKLGFDAREDAFNTISQTERTAVVEVVHDGDRYHVNLEATYKTQDNNRQAGAAQKGSQNKPNAQQSSATWTIVSVTRN